MSIELLTENPKMPLEKALSIAESCVEKLKPFCWRIEIAGSIRRKQPVVKDIEIVCIPMSEPEKDLFGDIDRVPVNGFIRVVNSWAKIKGEPTGRYTQRLLPEGINLDLFIAVPENWGYIYAIRTGSAEYSHKVLAKGWCRKGYNGKEGNLYKGGKVVNVYEEEDLFRLIGLPYAKPEEREVIQ